jgi:hypothetical protein
MVRRAVFGGLAVAGALALAAVSACGDKSSPASPSSTCSTFSTSPTTQTFSGGGGTGTLTINIPSGCTWLATSSASWLGLTAGASGSGQGTVSFAVAANPALSSRTASITVNGLVATVTQSGTPNDGSCRFDLAPTVKSTPASNTTFTAQVTAGSGCRWEASSNLSWIQVTIQGGTFGSGDGTAEIKVSANVDAASRTGQILVAGQVLNITQDGASAPACTYTISPASQSADAIGAAGTLSVSTGSGCSWWLDADQSWITFPNGTAGYGTAKVQYAILPNDTPSGRQATVRLHGDSGGVLLTQTVTQSGASCLYTVSPTQMTFSGTGSASATARITTSPSDCRWGAASAVSWMTVTSPEYIVTGAGTITFRVNENASGATRTGQILAAGLTGVNPPAILTVIQTSK